MLSFDENPSLCLRLIECNRTLQKGQILGMRQRSGLNEAIRDLVGRLGGAKWEASCFVVEPELCLRMSLEVCSGRDYRHYADDWERLELRSAGVS